jgi:predicted flap endonuclease-1-like 5' DNA nuclease
MARVIDIEGIGEKYAKKLSKVGIRSTRSLLNVAAHRQGRRDLAVETGISQRLLLEWVNLADLMRIKGIGEEYSDLLEEAGVDTIKELKNRVPESLYATLVDTNTIKHLVRRLPSLKDIKSWVKQAKTIESKIRY